MPQSKVSLAKIKKAVAQFIPYLESHGGSLEVMAWDSKTGTVEVKLRGACHGCALSSITLKQVIEANLRQSFSQVKKVVTID